MRQCSPPTAPSGPSSSLALPVGVTLDTMPRSYRFAKQICLMHTLKLVRALQYIIVITSLYILFFLYVLLLAVVRNTRAFYPIRYPCIGATCRPSTLAPDNPQSILEIGRRLRRRRPRRTITTGHGVVVSSVMVIPPTKRNLTAGSALQ